MAERTVVIDGEKHTYAPDPPGCFDKILGIIILIVIIVIVLKTCG